MKFGDWAFVKQEVEDESMQIERATHEQVSLELKFENPISQIEPVIETGDAVLIGIKPGTNDQLFMIDNGLDQSVKVKMGVNGPEYVYADHKPTYLVIDVSELYGVLSKAEIVSTIGDALLDTTIFKRSMVQLRQIKEQLEEAPAPKSKKKGQANDVGNVEGNLLVGGD